MQTSLEIALLIIKNIVSLSEICSIQGLCIRWDFRDSLFIIPSHKTSATMKPSVVLDLFFPENYMVVTIDFRINCSN